MLILLGTTLTASFFDSLNPSAIAQQMLLQAMVKKKRYILFFILGIALANFIMGMAIYYGIATWISMLLSKVTAAYPLYVCCTELITGLLCLVLGIRLIIRTKQSTDHSEQNMAKSPAQLTPLPLFLLGAVFCAVELTSALPYFGFIAILTSYDLVLPYVLFFMLLYDFIYSLPLILLYFGYNRLQSTVLIRHLEHILNKISSYVIPAALSLIGILLFFHSISSVL